MPNKDDSNKVKIQEKENQNKSQTTDKHMPGKGPRTRDQGGK